MIETIPQYLVHHRGNMTQAAISLGCNRQTVRRYARDFGGIEHKVIDGRLYILAARSKNNGA